MLLRNLATAHVETLMQAAMHFGLAFAIGIVGFDSRAAMNAALSEPRYLEIMRPDELKFIDIEGCLSFVGDERVMFDAASR